MAWVVGSSMARFISFDESLSLPIISSPLRSRQRPNSDPGLLRVVGLTGQRTTRYRRSTRRTSYRSKNPEPPGRFDMKNSVLPLVEISGVSSLKKLLTVGPRFRGL